MERFITPVTMEPLDVSLRRQSSRRSRQRCHHSTIKYSSFSEELEEGGSRVLDTRVYRSRSTSQHTKVSASS